MKKIKTDYERKKYTCNQFAWPSLDFLKSPSPCLFSARRAKCVVQQRIACCVCVFWAREWLFALGRHLGFENYGQLRKHLPRGGKSDKCPIVRLCTKPLQVKHPITIQDGGMEMALGSKIMPAMQANEAKISLSRQDNPVPDCGTKLSFLSLCFNYLVFNADQ